jgi:predicted XRE-type DNA-binding protein
MLLTVDGEGDGGPLLGGGKGTEEPVAHVVPDKYEFAKLKTKDDKGVETEVEAPTDVVTKVAEFAKTHKMSQAQAQAFLDHSLAQPKPPTVPEKYEFTKVKTKDEKGVESEVEVAKEISEPIAAFAKENGLSQEQAQKLLDREVASVEAANTEYQKQTDEMVKGWREEAKKDPVLGAGNFTENIGTAKKALDTFFPGLAKNVNDHMFLDHPMILRGLFEIGKKISPDGELITGKETEQAKSPESKMFPTMTKKK